MSLRLACWFVMGSVTPPMNQKVHAPWIFWRPAMYGTPQEKKVGGEGGKPPSDALRKRRPFRRGCRGGRVERTRSVRHTTSNSRSSGKANRVEPGCGCKAAHFLARFDRSVEAAIPVARQISDIKHRAESRRRLARTPLPPRAAEGLRRRQFRLRAWSRHWGDAYGRAVGVGSQSGRRYWRSLLFQRVLASVEAGRPEAATTLFGDVRSSVSVDSSPAPVVPVLRSRENLVIVPQGYRLWWECAEGGAPPASGCGRYGVYDGPLEAVLESCPECGGSLYSSVLPSGHVPERWHL